MIRKTAFVMAWVLVLSMLGGCAGGQDNTGTTQPESLEMPKLSEELKQEIETAWLAWDGYEFGTWYDTEAGTHGACYYGSYDGYEVFFMPTMLCVLSGKEIAGEIFTYSSSFVIYAYKKQSSAEFLLLENAYEDGLISTGSISEIAKIHRAYHGEMNVNESYLGIDADI